MCEQDSLKDYLKEIRKYPLLTFEDELALSQKIQRGDLSARKTLIESNLRLVVSVGRRYASPDMPLLDIIQEGNVGLITAAQKYEFSYNVRFSTYACWWIQQAITRAMANKRRMIRLPFRKEELVGQIRKASLDLFQTLSRQPTNEEIAYELCVSVQEIEDVLVYSSSVGSLDLELDGKDSFSLKDVLADRTYCPEDQFMKKCTRECILKILDELKESERDIIIRRYNLNESDKPATLKNIGQKYGVSAETIRQVELRVIRKLQARSHDLHEIINN
ncbi:MAG TPA: RNA polymerase sigma factor RpoD/SigA [Treponema sp.]|nr:RNA polymerase sigma factor RpoD/SigA [Treponema sp.]